MAEAELATIARPYARAAFSCALDAEEGLQKWSRMLGLLAAVSSEPVMSACLDNPVLSATDEAALLIDFLDEELDQAGQNFVMALSDYDRIALLPSIAELFELLKANHEKTMDVKISSAFEVSEEQQTIISAALTRKLQREVVLETEFETELLGGIVVRAEDTVIDDSVRGKLQKLAGLLN